MAVESILDGLKTADVLIQGRIEVGAFGLRGVLTNLETIKGRCLTLTAECGVQCLSIT
ncbi:hypothetical protein SAMN05444167_1081 [Terriglobus roseus]|uniref:Uncharacterized protein n=1 Tax=Terriglobus roseus TaxID=392734 RepID=A0A1G7HHL8_9BACT|nr:hypothetical protein SAMN05444167_1081 [Terriglobus roseus]